MGQLSSGATGETRGDTLLQLHFGKTAEQILSYIARVKRYGELLYGPGRAWAFLLRDSE